MCPEPRSQAPSGTTEEIEDSHVFNVYKGKERTVQDSRAAFCTMHMVGLRGKRKGCRTHTRTCTKITYTVTPTSKDDGALPSPQGWGAHSRKQHEGS